MLKFEAGSNSHVNQVAFHVVFGLRWGHGFVWVIFAMHCIIITNKDYISSADSEV